jgi:hypothetical protein
MVVIIGAIIKKRPDRDEYLGRSQQGVEISDWKSQLVDARENHPRAETPNGATPE